MLLALYLSLVLVFGSIFADKNSKQSGKSKKIIINDDWSINSENIPKFPTSCIEKALFGEPGYDKVAQEGITEISSGKGQQGILKLKKSLEMHPLQAGIWNALGVTFAKNGMLKLGIEYIKQGLKIEKSSYVYYQLFQIYNALKDSETDLAKKKHWETVACETIEQSASLLPKLETQHFALEVLHNNGICYYKQNKKKEALFEFSAALRVDENNELMRQLRAELYVELSVPLLAIADYQFLTELKSQQKREALVANYVRISQIYTYHLMDLMRAKEWAEKAYLMDSTHMPTLHLIGSLCLINNDFVCAIEFYEKALEYDNSQVVTFIELLNARRTTCDWRNYEKDLVRVRAIVQDDLKAGRKSHMAAWYALMWEFIDGVTMNQLAHNYMKQDFLPYASLRKYEHMTKLKPGERLRVGIVTADAGNTNVGRDMIGWFSHLNEAESNIEIHLFVIRKPDYGISYNYILKHCSHVHDLHSMTHEDSADYIYRQAIHILINLNGYTKFSRNEIFAMQPAPIQIAFKGYPGTLGAPYMQYLIGDRVTTPIEDESHFAEKLIVMPHCYFMATYPVSFAHVVDPKYVSRFPRSVRPKYGLPVDKFVFCNFNHLVKLTPSVFKSWMSILDRVPNSVLWLLKLPREGEANLKREAAERGIDSNRIIFTDFVPVADHLLVKGLGDLALDTFVFNGHGTGMDGLWAGLPVVTMKGPMLQSRALASYLTVLGVPELITYTSEEFENLAVELALDFQKNEQRSKLLLLREKIQSLRLTSPLFDTKRWLRDFGVAMNLVWSRYESGQAPEHVNVPAGQWQGSISDWISPAEEYVLDE